jgi:4-amino-4-deoxy-L-arabinose transferase-like glycosyltransferase
VVPAWQAPDETAHTAYVQSLGERGSLPGGARPLLSTEQSTAANIANTFQVTGQPLTEPEWSPRLATRYAQMDDLARDDGGGANPAGSNPPLYYLYETLAYEVAGGGDIWTRMLAMRLASVALLLVTVTAAWLLAGQIFRRDRRLQLVTAAFTGLLPMMTSISSSVNPDAMMIALWTLALWLGTVVLREGSRRAGVGLGLVTGLALVTKPTSYALILPVLIVLAVAARRWAAADSVTVAVRRLAASLATLAVPIGTWVIAARVMNRAADTQLATAAAAANLREFTTYVWQFYLPALPFQSDYRATHPAFQTLQEGLPLYDTWIRTGGAAFGYLEVQFAEPVYWFFAAAAVAAVVACVLSLRGRMRRLDVATGVFFVSLVLILLAGLHWTEYRLIQGGGQSFIQGRYLLPVAALGALVLAQATTLAPAGRARTAVHAGILGVLAMSQLYSLALVMARFYA